uniref:Uncharacterized serine-rich protein C215.13-like isoform X2 n=1 Tax=Crassostrea virginica TaxID=6565 RepID=A0A8B8BLC6_CRAVI|nr:uncharacterized serine-rich protein C215.13-like isoform X2 [Crassostrea virginica]
MSGSVPCFLKLDGPGKQLTVERNFNDNNIEACAKRCFKSSSPGFVYKEPTCILLKSQPTGDLSERSIYTNKIIDWVSSTASIEYTIPPEEVCSIISSTAISSMSADLVTASASSTSQTTSSPVQPVSFTTRTTSSAVLSTSSMAETISIFSLDPSSLSHVTSDTSSSTTPSIQTVSETTFSSPITSILSSNSPCYCPCRLVRNVSFTPVELQKR